MAKVTISYVLSEAGQKASLLAGGDGKREQGLTLTQDSPHFAAALAQARVNGTGDGLLDLSAWDEAGQPTRFDAPPTTEELLADRPRRKAALEAAEQECRDRVREETLAVLAARETKAAILVRCAYRTDAGGVAYRDYGANSASANVREAAWPYPADAGVKRSPEATAWLAELAAAREAEIAALEREALAKLEAAEAREAAEAAREKAEREALGLEDGEIALAVEGGALTEVPAGCWESHPRGKNWLATVTASPSSPGGLAREFHEKAKGRFYYLTGGLEAGRAIEFGSDYYTGGGRKNSRRWYGVVVRVTDAHVVVRQSKGSATAINDAAKLREKLAEAPAERPEVVAARNALAALTPGEREALLAEFAAAV